MLAIGRYPQLCFLKLSSKIVFHYTILLFSCSGFALHAVRLSAARSHCLSGAERRSLHQLQLTTLHIYGA
jgi:hypothetical protein